MGTNRTMAPGYPGAIVSQRRRQQGESDDAGSGYVKMLTPPGPTSSPTMMSTMPQRS